jgi:hypothetical protein
VKVGFGRGPSFWIAAATFALFGFARQRAISAVLGRTSGLARREGEGESPRPVASPLTYFPTPATGS